MPNKNISDLHTLMIEEIKKTYSVENKLSTALDEMAEMATDPDLKELFRDHKKETVGQKQRLDVIAESLDEDLKGGSSEIIDLMIKKTTELCDQIDDPILADIMLCSEAIKVEHLEIASYEGMIEKADSMDHKNEKKLLQETLSEEESSAKKIAKMLKTLISKAEKSDNSAII